MVKVLEKARWELGAKTISGEKVDGAEYYAKAILSSGLVIPVSALDGMTEKVMRKAFEERNEGYEFPSEAAMGGALNNFAFGWFAVLNAIKEEAGK